MPIKLQRERPRWSDLEGVSAELIKRKLNPKYFTHDELFLQLPGINADIDQVYTVEAARALTKNWEILGANSTTALATYTEGGGVTLTTGGVDNDQMILAPHLDTKHSALAQMNWDSANEPYMYCSFVTGASVADVQFWFGYRTTDSVSEVTPAAVIADPADQFMLMFSDEGAESTTEWTAVSTRSGTDTETLAYPNADDTSTGIALAASTLYRLEMYLDRDRVPHYYINGQEVANGDNTALTAVSTLDPYVAVQTLTGGAKAISVRRLIVSQLYG